MTHHSSTLHRHGSLTHDHEHSGPHRHAPPAWRRSEHVAHGERDAGHGHSHGLIDRSILRSRQGIRAVALSLLVLGLAAGAQLVIFLTTNSIALLADLIHNFGDAATAL